MRIHCITSKKEYRMLKTVYVIANTRSSQHRLHGIMGRRTIRYEIINALLLKEAANQRMTMEKWVGYEEEDSLIPRGMEILDKIDSHEVWDNDTPTLNIEIRVLAYTGHDSDPIKVQPEWHICTHENTWLRKVSWDPLQWMWRILMRIKEAKPSLSFNSRLD